MEIIQNRYENKEIKNKIVKIKDDLIRDLYQKDRIYLVSPQFIKELKVMRILGDIGFTCRIDFLFSLS